MKLKIYKKERKTKTAKRENEIKCSILIDIICGVPQMCPRTDRSFSLSTPLIWRRSLLNMDCRYTNMPMTVKYMVPASLMPHLLCRPTSHNVLMTCTDGCGWTGCNLTVRRQRWCGVPLSAGYRNFPTLRSSSLAQMFIRSEQFETSESTWTVISVRLLTFRKPCHAVLPLFASFVICVDMSLATAFVR